MKILLDENFPLGLVRALQADGFDVDHIITLGMRGASDAQIRERLSAAKLIFLTVKLDLDPEVEAGLVAQAQARGLSLEAYVQQVLKERSAIPAPMKASEAAAKAREFRAFGKRHRAVGSRTDESLRREHLIRDAQ